MEGVGVLVSSEGAALASGGSYGEYLHGMRPDWKGSAQIKGRDWQESQDFISL